MFMYSTAGFSRGNIQSQFCAPELIQQIEVLIIVAKANPTRARPVANLTERVIVPHTPLIS